MGSVTFSNSLFRVASGSTAPCMTFTGGNDGSETWGPVTLDSNGNLYGTAFVGGQYGYGVVWEITP